MDLELAAFVLPSQLFFESSNLDPVELCARTEEFDVLLFGQFEELSVEGPLLSSLHLPLVLGAALWVLSADVATEGLGASEEFIALRALELLCGLAGGFNQIEVAFDLHDSVSGLW